jgi:hypothetical protein
MENARISFNFFSCLNDTIVKAEFFAGCASILKPFAFIVFQIPDGKNVRVRL